MDTVCRLWSSEVWIYCWNGFIWTKSRAQVKHVLYSVCQALSDSSLWQRQPLVHLGCVRNTAFKFPVFHLRISLKLFRPHLRGHCFVSPGVSVSAGKAGIRERPFIAWMSRLQPVQTMHFWVTRTRKQAVYQVLLLHSSPQENGNKLVPMAWIISSTRTATIIVIKFT